jgi:hypothetical protein
MPARLDRSPVAGAKRLNGIRRADDPADQYRLRDVRRRVLAYGDRKRVTSRADRQYAMRRYAEPRRGARCDDRGRCNTTGQNNRGIPINTTTRVTMAQND